MTHPPAASAFAALAALLPLAAAAAQGDAKAPAFPASQQKAVDYLMGQQKDGVFSASYNGRQFPDPAVTGFGLMALQTKPKELRSDAEKTAIEHGIAWLLKNQNEDGSFGRQVLNYSTSAAVGALARSGDPAAKAALGKAQNFLLACQAAEAGGSKPSDPNYGGTGYGDKGDARADLSNTNFTLQALRESGLPPDHEAFAKAITFLQRSQNLTKVNDFKGKVADPEHKDKMLDVGSGDDGGGIYYPGNSAAGYAVTPDGKAVPRSYGSMTYSLLKAYTLCGVKPDDARVQAAVKWVSAHWQLDENPGFDPKASEEERHQGLFYYYMVMAQALDLVGSKELAGAGDKKEAVDWRKALRSHLEKTQHPDGSWKNDKNGRWMEDSGVLCACYALLALEKCK